MNSRIKIVNLFRPLTFITLMIVSMPNNLKAASLTMSNSVSTIDGQFIPDQVIVKYKNNVSNYSALYQTYWKGGELIKTLNYTPKGQGPIQITKTISGLSVSETIAELSKNPDVEYAQPNYIYHTSTTDARYGDLWGLKNTGQGVTGANYPTATPATSGTLGKDINAEGAWGIITDCSSTVVAVVDSGINYNQEDLAANMVNDSYSCPGGTGTKGCDFVGTGDADPMDFFGHGTHVAGIIGAKANNTVGITGVCQSAKILAVRVLDATGSGVTSDIVEGVNFAAGQGAGQGKAKVINMSLGGKTYDTLFNDAITTAQNNGVVVVVAAGNGLLNHSGVGISFYPCDYTQDNIICVGAIDQNYNWSNFSDYDNNATVANRKVDIAAPGTNILSTYVAPTLTTLLTDNFGAGTLNWQKTGNWGYVNFTWGGAARDTIANPANFNGTTNFYNSYAGDYIYKQFSIPSSSNVRLDFYAYIDLQYLFDGLSIYHAVSGSPFNRIDNIMNGYLTGSTGPNAYLFSYELSMCANQTTCSVGFYMNSNASTQFTGVDIFLLTLSTLDTTVINSYAVENGTSMASPFVAGIATMVRARNPDYTYTDTVNALMKGGDLAVDAQSNTKSGRVADAYGSLVYIPDENVITLSTP
ncbi:MAG: S8 family serine peptidase [Spirochaetia bacterium]|nr:S8 family serine peptidase [Spirochaetia bacterium]